MHTIQKKRKIKRKKKKKKRLGPPCFGRVTTKAAYNEQMAGLHDHSTVQQGNVSNRALYSVNWGM